MNQDDHKQDDPKKDVEGKPKPIPIREAVGEPAPRPAGKPDVTDTVRPSQAPGLRGQRRRPEGPRGKGSASRSDGGGPRRRDRGASGSGREGPERPPLERTPPEDLPFRSFEHEGCEWIVRLCGQTSTGSAADPGAPMMHLTFYIAADPLVACGELLVPGRSLEGLTELQLPELLAKAEPGRSPNESSG